MGKVLKWRDQKSALEEATEFEKTIGFDAVMVIGLVKDKPHQLFVGMTEGLKDKDTVFILQCAITRICLETVLESDEEE